MKRADILRFNGKIYDLIPVSCDKFRLRAYEEKQESPYRDIGDVLPFNISPKVTEITCDSLKIKGKFYGLMLREKK